MSSAPVSIGKTQTSLNIAWEVYKYERLARSLASLRDPHVNASISPVWEWVGGMSWRLPQTGALSNNTKIGFAEKQQRHKASQGAQICCSTAISPFFSAVVW